MPVLHFVPRQSRDSAGVAVRAFESATAEVVARRNPLGDRTTLYVLGGLIVVLLVFCSVFQLDRIVEAPGRIVSISGAITVQPYGEGIIKTIKVSVGDVVKKGQILAVLDPTFATADLTALQEQVASLDAMARRLVAQDAFKPFVPIGTGPYEALQASLWSQQDTLYRSSVENLDQQISAMEAQIAGLQRDIANYTQRLKIAQDIEGMRTSMQARGFESRLTMLGATDERVQIAQSLSDSENKLASDQHTLAALKAQRNSYIETWHSNNLSTLVTTRDALDAAQQSLAKAVKMDELVNLVAPEDAIVTQIPQLSGGAIATMAQPLFSLVPLNAPLEADVQIDASQAGYVELNDRVELKFDTFQYLEHGSGEGVVRAVTQDSFVSMDPQDAVSGTSGSQTRTPYFDAKVKVVAVNLHDIPGGFHLTPGMTLTADIICGRRTIMWYLLGGALRSGAEAMHEPN